MQFRGKINSLDIDFNAQMIDMSVTVGDRNFDVSFEMLWGEADEFDGWEQLAKIVDQNRYDRKGAVMADINAGRRELEVKYDGGDAYAYGDEASVDVETENIPGKKGKETMRTVYENSEFDFKKFVAENKLEKNLKKAKKKKKVEENGPRPKRKHRKNPTRFGRGSHGKIPHFDDAITSADPSYPYGIDDPSDIDAKSAKARKAARDMGLEPELDKAKYDSHFGRGGGEKWTGESDPFRWKNPNKRVTKGGKLHKTDLRTAKQDSKDSLAKMKSNRKAKADRGAYLPEDLQNEDFNKVDERLKSLRENEGMIDAAMVEELLEDFVETMQIQGVAIDDIGPKEITQFMKFGKSNALKALGTEYK